MVKKKKKKKIRWNVQNKKITGWCPPRDWLILGLIQLTKKDRIGDIIGGRNMKISHCSRCLQNGMPLN